MKQRTTKRFRTISALKEELTQSGYLKEVHTLGAASETSRVWYTTNLFALMFDRADVSRKTFFEKILLDNGLIYNSNEINSNKIYNYNKFSEINDFDQKYALIIKYIKYILSVKKLF